MLATDLYRERWIGLGPSSGIPLLVTASADAAVGSLDVRMGEKENAVRRLTIDLYSVRRGSGWGQWLPASHRCGAHRLQENHREDGD